MSALCAHHPAEVALGACHRCGTFVCASCSRADVDRVFCVACWPRVAQRKSVLGRSVAAIFLGLIGAVVPLIALFAVLLGLAELRAIRNGTKEHASRVPAQCALYAGMAGGVVWGLAAIGYIAL